MKKPTVRKPLRRGSLVYHGTSMDAEFDMLEGPAWVSNDVKVAREFVGWAGGNGEPRILTFEIVEAPALAILTSSRDVEELAVWLGERFGLGEGVGGSVHDLAQDLCAVGRRIGIDGWHIPNNYASGSDTMICEPERFLRLSSVELVGRAWGKAPVRRRSSRR